MTTLAEPLRPLTKPRIRRAYRPTTALAQQVTFDQEEWMAVHLTDGRIIQIPLIWFPLLHEATAEQRTTYEIGAGGASLHWPDIDEDISVAGLLAGGQEP